MADPQQYTDAQLSDGRTLRFIGDLDPDTVRAKVQTFRAKEAITNNPPPVPRPQLNMQQVDMSGNPQNPAAGMAGVPGGSPNPQSAGPGYTKAVGIPLGAAAAVMGGPTVLPFLAGGAKAAWPYVKGGAKAGAGYAATEAVVQGAKKLPGVGDYVSKIPGIDYLPFLVGLGSSGKGEEPAPEVEQARPIGQGSQPYHDPAAGLGEIPVRGTPAPIAAPPVSRTAVNQQLDTQLRTAVGNKPIQPGVPLRNQWRPQPASASLESSGMTPVEGSAAVKAFRYDPSAQEMHVMSKDGTTYISGEVNQDQFEAFRDSDSKGQAWKAIRDNSPLVGKILPGGSKRIAIKPTIRSATPNDYEYLNDPAAWNAQNRF